MRQFSLLLPTGWAMDGLHKLLSYGAAPVSILPHIAALLSLACLAGWISYRRFRFE
jgi:ABC-type multidrug transport system permease subunit